MKGKTTLTNGQATFIMEKSTKEWELLEAINRRKQQAAFEQSRHI